MTAWAGIYNGVVVAASDPAGQGRVRLRVPQVSGSATTGWVSPAQAGGRRPSVGQSVYVLYLGGQASYPVYLPPIPAAVSGTAVLSGSTAVTVPTTAVTGDSKIFLTIQVPGTAPGAPYVSGRTVGASFQVKSTSATDTSTVAWSLV